VCRGTKIHKQRGSLQASEYQASAQISDIIQVDFRPLAESYQWAMGAVGADFICEQQNQLP